MPKKSSKTKTTKTTKSTSSQEAAPVAPSTNQVASAPVDTPPTVAEQVTARLAQLSVLRSQVTSITSQVHSARTTSVSLRLLQNLLAKRKQQPSA